MHVTMKWVALASEWLSKLQAGLKPYSLLQHSNHCIIFFTMFSLSFKIYSFFDEDFFAVSSQLQRSPRSQYWSAPSSSLFLLLPTFNQSLTFIDIKVLQLLSITNFQCQHCLGLAQHCFTQHQHYYCIAMALEWLHYSPKRNCFPL